MFRVARLTVLTSAWRGLEWLGVVVAWRVLGKVRYVVIVTRLQLHNAYRIAESHNSNNSRITETQNIKVSKKT